MYLGPAFAFGSKIAQWPVIFALVTLAIALLYYYAPREKQKLGALARRAYAQGKAAGTLKPAIAAANCDVDQT